MPVPEIETSVPALIIVSLPSAVGRVTLLPPVAGLDKVKTPAFKLRSDNSFVVDPSISVTRMPVPDYIRLIPVSAR